MAKAKPTLALSPSRDIPLDQLFLSPANVRRTKSGDAIGQLADDIARRGLLQSLNVRPELDGEGQATGRFEIPAGGRRFRALELLVKQKRLAKDVQVPCVVRAANDDILAEDDSLAENAMRENLHPLDQFCAMQAMVDKGDDVEEIAAHFFVTPAVVRQRLKLAAVSPKLHEVYAEDGMSLEQLMAFTVSDDHGVRFGPAARVMAAGEGIETILSLREAVPALSMIAGLSGAHLAALVFPAGLKRLYVARDDDPAGGAALSTLSERAEQAGIELLPLEPEYGDFNDDLVIRGRSVLAGALRTQFAAADRLKYL